MPGSSSGDGERQQASKDHDSAMAQIGQESLDKQKALDDEYAQKLAAVPGGAGPGPERVAGRHRRSQAEAGRQGSPRAQIASRHRQSIPDYLEGLAPVIQQAKEKTIGVSGTFNAMEARGLGAGGVTDRIAKASEETAKNTKKMLEELEDAEEPDFT